MSIFESKPVYTSQDLNAAVERIERLTALSDKAEKMYRLTQKSEYGQSYDRLTRNIATAQQYLDYITGRLLPSGTK